VREAPVLQCSNAVQNELITLNKSPTAEVRRAEGPEFVQLCLQDQENQQVAQEVCEGLRGWFLSPLHFKQRSRVG